MLFTALATFLNVAFKACAPANVQCKPTCHSNLLMSDRRAKSAPHHGLRVSYKERVIKEHSQRNLYSITDVISIIKY